MKKITLDQVDEPVFDLSSARLSAGTFFLEGIVLLQGGNLLGERGGSRDWQRFVIQLCIADATSFTVDDVAGLGELVLEEIRETDEGVLLRGVIPCSILVCASVPTSTTLALADRSRL